MSAYTQSILDGNYDVNNMTDEQLEYKKYVEAMKRTYESVGDSHAASRVLNTVDMIIYKIN